MPCTCTIVRYVVALMSWSPSCRVRFSSSLIVDLHRQGVCKNAARLVSSCARPMNANVMIQTSNARRIEYYVHGRLIFDIVIINLVSMMRRRRRKNNSKRPGTLFIKHETQSICCQAKRDPRARPLKKIQINKCHRLAHNKLLASKSPQATLESIV